VKGRDPAERPRAVIEESLNDNQSNEPATAPRNFRSASRGQPAPENEARLPHAIPSNCCVGGAVRAGDGTSVNLATAKLFPVEDTPAKMVKWRRAA